MQQILSNICHIIKYHTNEPLQSAVGSFKVFLTFSNSWRVYAYFIFGMVPHHCSCWYCSCIEKYGTEDGVPAVFQILYFIGWKPDKSQVTLLVTFCR